MDSWKNLDVHRYVNFSDFLEKNNNPKIFMATTKAKKCYSDVKYDSDAYIMFGPESRGIPEAEFFLEIEVRISWCQRVPTRWRPAGPTCTRSIDS